MPSIRRGAIVLAEEEPVTPRRRRLVRGVVAALVAVLVLGGYLAVRSLVGAGGAGTCQATALGTSVTFDTEQMSNAATITGIAMKRGLPARAATIAIATAITESKLRNLHYGDRDSLGLFQQRPSQGWGTAAQILDPVHATNAFYDALVKITGYQTMNITDVAQAVQRSANPQAYAAHEQQGRIIASVLSGYSPAGIGCRLDPPTTPSTAASVASLLFAQLGETAQRSGSTLVVRTASQQEAWSVGAWAVAKAADTGLTSVTVGARRWTRASGRSALTWTAAASPQAATTVLIQLG